MMNRASRIGPGLVTGLVAALLTVASVPASQAAATVGWRIVFTRHYGQVTGDSGYTAVVVPRPGDAWVFGCGCGDGHVEAEHWNGARWRAAALPTGLPGGIAAASAPSASDIWAASTDHGYVLHWNGSQWSVALRLKESGYSAQFTSVSAFSASNAWVFGGVIEGETGLVGLGTWHFNGTTWTQVKGVGGSVAQASALSASDIWGVGSGGVQHFNGTTWRKVTVPRSIGTERYVLADSPADVWIDGDNTSTSRQRPALIQWNGTGWQRVAVDAPPGTDLLGKINPDGDGGIWIEAGNSATGREWMLHRSATGQWTWSTLGPAGHYLNDYALVPGTSSLWGVGESATGNGASNAVIWAYGPTG